MFCLTKFFKLYIANVLTQKKDESENWENTMSVSSPKTETGIQEETLISEKEEVYYITYYIYKLSPVGQRTK